MTISKLNISGLVDAYLHALQGQDIRSAIIFHAEQAGIKLDFVEKQTVERILVQHVFQAAEGQEKARQLLDIILKDGFDITLHNMGDDFEDTKYREWLKSETNAVDIRGIGKRSPLEESLSWPILKLYTELYVQTGLTNFDLEEGNIRGRKRISLSEMLDATHCLVVMGDPGSGKTTFLKFVARKQVDDKQKHLPIFLRLRQVYDYILKNDLAFHPDALIDYCIDLSNKEDLGFNRHGLENRCDSGNILWLMDGLDELPSTESREEMVEKVIERASKKWDNCKFVMTSRIKPLKGKAIPKGFEVVCIDYWGKDEIQSFLRVWTKLLYPKATEEFRRRHWGNLLSSIIERPELESLARNALMVTAMAVVHFNEKRLPEGRADLLEAVIYWLVRARGRTSVSPRTTVKFTEDMYRNLALAMFEHKEGRKNVVGQWWAANQLKSNFDDNLEAALEFLSLEENETGVLVRRGEGDIAFWHLSFQEYLAAREIAGKTDDPDTGWWPKIRENLDKPEWLEVLILVAACLNSWGSDRVDLFFERLGKSCIDDDLNTKIKRIALGGNILRDLKLAGYEPGEAPSWSHVLDDVFSALFESNQLTTNELELETRYQAGIAYGLWRNGDRRLRNFEDTWIKLPGGSFMMGAQAEDKSSINYDPDAASWEGPVCEIKVKPFEIRKYPITVQEYSEFVSDNGYQDRNYWTTEGWQWHNQFSIQNPLDWKEQCLAPNCPITGVSWFEAEAYCLWLTCKNNGKNYRLPSEAEWEFAAKRGLTLGNHFPWGNIITPGDKVEANCAWSGLRKKAPIGMFPKCVTEDGIYDMFGNVEEWCADSWTPDHSNRPKGGTAWVEANIRWRVVRGGSTIRFARLCRPTYRSRIYKDKRYHPVGFRPIRHTST